MKQILIPKLKLWIEPLSVNQLKSIFPRILKKQLEVSDKDLKELIDFLHKERILAYRYRFKCDKCGNYCIAYDRALNAGNYTCSECGKIILFDDIAQKCEVVYEIKKEEVMKLDSEIEIDFTKAAIGSNIINLEACKKQTDGGTIMDIKNKKVIFFGSSSEATDIMDEVAAIVGNQGYTTLKWNSPNAEIFMPGENIIDNLIETTKRIDGAIFIFNADDKTWFNSKMESKTVRDNVLFEYGLFMGKLGKTKVAIASKNNPYISSDLKGITYIDVNEDESVWGQKLKAWLKKMTV